VGMPNWDGSTRRLARRFSWMALGVCRVQEAVAGTQGKSFAPTISILTEDRDSNVTTAFFSLRPS